MNPAMCCMNLNSVFAILHGTAAGLCQHFGVQILVLVLTPTHEQGSSVALPMSRLESVVSVRLTSMVVRRSSP